jgi:hypothetical protein
MQFKDYKKYLLFVFTFLCCGFIKAQPGPAGEIYLNNVNCKKYDVLAYAFIDSDSIKTVWTKEVATELISIKVYKYTKDIDDGNTPVGIDYIARDGSLSKSLCNKLLVEIYNKKHKKCRMTILVVGGFEYYPLPYIDVDINFEEGLFLLEIPAIDYQNIQKKRGKRGWDLSSALKKIY